MKRLGRGDIDQESTSASLITTIPPVGESEEFWLVDVGKPNVYRATATVRVITAHAIWYVESNLDFDSEALAAASKIFENTIYPRVTEAFGTPSFEGVPKLSIFNGDLRGSGGYFTSNDHYPESIHPYSNHRSMLYIDAKTQQIGTDRYLSVLAHELQHFIHDSIDGGEETWINEGLAELASEVAGYPTGYLGGDLPYPRVSLTNWPTTLGSTYPYYVTSLGFFRYLTKHYSPTPDLKSLVREAADGTKGINVYLATLGTNHSFTDIFQSWAIEGATAFLNQKRSAAANQLSSLAVNEDIVMSIPPFAPTFIRIAPSDTLVLIRFTGNPTVALLPMDLTLQSPCWWGNRGDSIHSKLTRQIDLSTKHNPSLRFQIWYDIESSWDYAYVTASTDGGKSLQILHSTRMTEYNPVGNALGPGYSGTSRGWISDEIDLTPFAGKSVLLSFEYLTDDGLHGPGLCIKDIQIESDGLVHPLDQEWVSSGFYYTDNTLPTEFRVNLLELSPAGSFGVRVMRLDQANVGELRIGPQESESLAVVSFVTKPTTQEATFTLAITEP